MNRPLARFTPEILTVLLVSAAIFYACSDHWQTVLRKSEKKAFTAFINSHPFTLREKKTPKEWKKLPKKDRPDLAWEQNYLMTLDPATGSPAEERLIIPLAQVEDFVDDPSRYAPGDVNFPWVERGPDNVAGRTRAILWDPNNENRVFAGGVAGGLWYNDNITSSTQEWQKVNDFWDNIAVSCIEADPSNSDVWYVGTGEGWGNLDAVRGLGIWKTEDGGNSWDHLLSTANNSFRYTQKILVHPTTGHVYAATNTGLRRSTNGGSSWSLVLNNGNGANNNFIADLEIGADNAIWAAVQGDGVYRTTSGNSGTWTKLNSGNGFPSFGFNRIEIATAPSDASVAYALVVSGSVVDAIYKTENTGATWTSVNEPADADPGIPDTDFTRNQGWYDLISAVDPNDPDHIYVGGIDIFHSFNGGDTWNQISHWYGGFGEPYAHADQHGMAFKPGSSNEMIFSHDGGLTYTANASATQPSIGDRNNGYNVTQYYACAINPTAGSNNYLAGAQDNGTQRYDDPGMNSTTEVTGGDGMFCHIDQTDPTYQISSYVYNNYYRSVNQGVSFSGLPGGENTGRFINPTDYDNEQDILFGAKDNSTLRRITGITSTPSVSDMTIPALNGTASHIRVSEFTSGTSTIFVGTGSGNILKINNAQAAPSTMNIDSDAELPNGYISCIELGSNEDEILVTFSNYGVNSVWYTTDGGSNWVSKEGDLPDMPVRWALFNPDNQEEVILATEVGVWSTANFSANNPNWVPSNSGLANTRVDMLQIRESDNQVIAATHGRGLFSGVFFTPSYADDAGIIAVQEPNGVVCNQTTIPSVTLKNFGSEDLTSVDIEYSLDGGTTEVYEWTGTILPGDFEEVSLPEISYSVGSHTLVVSTSQPNGVEDEDPLNDSFTSDFEFGNNPVIVQIVTDNFGAETTWEIIDSNGSIVAEGGPYTNHQANGEYPEPDVQVCLQNGCYDFSIYDTYGDGMCCAYGNGSYTLLDADGNVLITGGDGWNNSETVEFCVSSPVPGVDNDAGITEILNVSDDVCGSEITPTVRIKNLGQSNLTSANINYDVDGQQSFTYNWTGNLASNATEIVDLPIMSFTGTGPHTFTASTELPNGVEDEVPSNDSQTFDFLSEDGNGATLTLTTDCWGEEVSWTITDEGGSVIASVSQNTLADNTTFTTDLCLETGCYDFTINDSYGDGLDGTASGCGQDGDYIITDSEGNVLVEMGNPDYGFSITQSFCIGETDVPGCTNILACNYNASATIDDGSCILIGDSCDDGDPTTVNDSVNGSCECEGDVFPGCTNELACNYNPIATLDDGSCLFTGDTCDDGDPDTVNDEIDGDCNCQGDFIAGCTNSNACNYDPNATVDDGSCVLIGDSCDDGDPTTVGDEINSNCECQGETIPGCMNEAACNYDPNATVDDGSCILIGDSCDDGDPTTVGDEINANCECEGETIPGCMNEAACNYDPNATVDDGSCILIGDSCDDGDPTTVGDEINANCECQGETIPGCTNEAACNYDPNATVDDGSCILIGDSCDDGDPTTVGDEINANCECEGETVPGCMNEAACNYDPNATVDDGSCILIGDSCDDGDPATVNDEFNSSCVCEGQTVPGCTDANACNYDPGATVDDGTCLYPNDSCDDGDPETGNDMFDENCNCSGEVILGCVIPIACNYNPEATVDDGSCLFPGDSCDDGDPTTANDTLEDNCDCNGEVIPGCMDNTACNYNAEATVDDGSCDYSCYGCTDETACNFDPSATLDDGECVFGTTLYLDSDGDGFGNPDQSITSCGEEGYVEDNTDCDDMNPDVYPGAPGTNEGIDNNCDGEVGPGEVPTCLADFNNSGYINTADLLIFLSHYDCQENCECDLNGDDTVETSDLLIMLSLMGTNCTD